MGISTKMMIPLAVFCLLVATPIGSTGQQLEPDGAAGQGGAKAEKVKVLEWAGLIKDIIVAVAAAVTAVAALRGLGSWRKEIKGRRGFEVAETLLRDAYQVEAAVRSFRNPLQGASEIEEARKELALDESKRQDAFESTRAVFELRWRHLGEAWANLNASVVEARVLWGDGVQDWLRPLSDCVKQLRTGLRGWVRVEQAWLRGQLKEDWYKDKIAAIEDVICDTSGDDSLDKFSQEMAKALEQLSQKLRGYLQ